MNRKSKHYKEIAELALKVFVWEADDTIRKIYARKLLEFIINDLIHQRGKNNLLSLSLSKKINALIEYGMFPLKYKNEAFFIIKEGNLAVHTNIGKEKPFSNMIDIYLPIIKWYYQEYIGVSGFPNDEVTQEVYLEKGIVKDYLNLEEEKRIELLTNLFKVPLKGNPALSKLINNPLKHNKIVELYIRQALIRQNLNKDRSTIEVLNHVRTLLFGE